METITIVSERWQPHILRHEPTDGSPDTIGETALERVMQHPHTRLQNEGAPS